ncbi:4731_t:CDS:2, partial [Gigaspora rosea]
RLHEAKQEYNTKKNKKNDKKKLQTYKKSSTDFDNKAFEIDSDNDDYDSVSIYSEQTNRSTGSITSQNANMSQISNPNDRWNPNLISPNHKQLVSQILKEAADGMQNIIKTKAQKDSNNIMLVFDEWKNVAKQEILGSILVTSRCKLLICEAKDIS